jgi:phage terminase large subunit-like protein
MVPELEEGQLWPTLGAGVSAFIESYLVYGPGDLLGEPYRLDGETKAIIACLYEVYPKKPCLCPARCDGICLNAGRRRFKHGAISKAKGTSKTELAAVIVAVELHPDGPVRTVSWGVRGDPTQPVGGGVTDPYIPMIAYTEEQTERLAYGALYEILSRSSLAPDFDIGLKRIMRRGGDGRAEALATAPDAADGALTTFMHIDESHRFTLPRQIEAVQVMKQNIPKRFAADAWMLETTTAYALGEGSVAEGTHERARKIAGGEVRDTTLFYFHRQADPKFDLAQVDLTTDEGLDRLREVIAEARSPDEAKWADIESIVAEVLDPSTDLEYWQRVWLNLSRKGAGKAFDAEQWKKLYLDYAPAKGGVIAAGFDGSRYHDATVLRAAEVLTGHHFTIGFWENDGTPDWEVPEDEVEEAVAQMFKDYDVWRLYADPYYWEGNIARWSGLYGDKVMRWPTNRLSPMAYAVQKFQHAVSEGSITHDGDVRQERHIGHAVKRVVSVRDGEGKHLWVIQKERPDSPFKIDGAMADILAEEARQDAIAAGAGKKKRSVYEKRRGLLSVG